MRQSRNQLPDLFTKLLDRPTWKWFGPRYSQVYDLRNLGRRKWRPLLQLPEPPGKSNAGSCPPSLALVLTNHPPPPSALTSHTAFGSFQGSQGTSLQRQNSPRSNKAIFTNGTRIAKAATITSASKIAGCVTSIYIYISVIWVIWVIWNIVQYNVIQEVKKTGRNFTEFKWPMIFLKNEIMYMRRLTLCHR